MPRFQWTWAVLLFWLLPPGAAQAQDTRPVSEPRVPPSCVAVPALLKVGELGLAPEQELALDTARIQSAIDGCARGHAVVLRADAARTTFLTGPLTLRTGVTLVVDAGAVLVGSRDPRLYDLTPGSCGVVNEKGHGCRPLIAADDTEHSGVMGPGVIDGRGGATLLGQKVSWWELAQQAKVTDAQQSVPWMIVVRRARDFTLYNVTLRNSPGFHVAVNGSDGFTAWGVRIMTPKTARNTDGIDPGSTRNVTIAHCSIRAGDDNVAVKSGPGGAASNISVLHNHFYTGHGMSIGSNTNGGVDHMVVDDLTIDGADNGIRIKSDPSRGGLVHAITYRNVCIRDTKNPLVFTPHYTNLPGTALPEYRDITLENVRVLGGGSDTLLGLNTQHKLGLTLRNVFLDNTAGTRVTARDAELTVAGGNMAPEGEDVVVHRSAGTAGPLDCEARFVPFPGLPTEKATGAPAQDRTLYVAADGSGDFSSVQNAVDAAPASGALVLLAPGTYREAVTIAKPHVELRGTGKDARAAVIVMDRSAGTSGGTGRSATVTVTGDDFKAENLTIQNDFNRTHAQQQEGSQAVALMVTGDRALFSNVRLLGNQDTLYAASRDCTGTGEMRVCPPARQFFTHCYVEGNVDFIFGDAKAVFEDCELHSTSHNGGVITAQSKSYTGQDSGFVIDRSRLTAAPGVEHVWLGRPWRPYATVVYLHTEMGAQIDPAGWREWHPGETQSLGTAFFAEAGSSGPGAGPAAREPHAHQLSPTEAEQFAPKRFLAGADGWNPGGSK